MCYFDRNFIRIYCYVNTFLNHGPVSLILPVVTGPYQWRPGRICPGEANLEIAPYHFSHLALFQ